MLIIDVTPFVKMDVVEAAIMLWGEAVWMTEALFIMLLTEEVAIVLLVIDLDVVAGKLISVTCTELLPVVWVFVTLIPVGFCCILIGMKFQMRPL